MALFDKAGIEAAKEMHELADHTMATADQLLDKADTVVHNIQVRLSDLAHGIIDRFECELHFKIKPVRAKAVNPPPD
jgi:hypothetical protein